MAPWIFGLALTATLLWFFYCFLIGKPWTVRGLFTRTFLRFALRGPELLTYLGLLERLGIHGHNARLNDASEAYATKTYAFLKKDLAILRRFRTASLRPLDRVSAAVMEWFLDDQVSGERWRYHDYPVNQMFGVQSSLPDFMMTMHPLRHPADIRNYAKRLERFGIKIDQVLEGLRLREERGCLPPGFMVRRVLAEMRAFIAVTPEKHPLYLNFRKKTEGGARLKETRQARLAMQVAARIEQIVYPAYRRLIAYFETLEARRNGDHGVWSLPDGDAFYAYVLRSRTTSEYSPEEVHAIGLAEVERIEAAMTGLLREQGLMVTSSPAAALARIAAEERFLYSNDDAGRAACLADYQSYLDQISSRLDGWFDNKPRARLQVERIPEFKEATAPGAYYQPADLSGSRPGVFYANLRDMKEVHKLGMKTLAYHEGIPGHHFQIALAQEQKKLPFFRRNLPFTAYTEGWAMYSEQLAREMGMYDNDPFGLLGSYDSELFRAVRLVVDTGIHYKRWSREQAIDYMKAHSAQAEESIVSEVERYFVMPGQACSYKIGMIKMLQLRTKAREALGSAFSLSDWHRLVLSAGAMPLSILERLVDEYIEDRRRQNQG